MFKIGIFLLLVISIFGNVIIVSADGPPLPQIPTALPLNLPEETNLDTSMIWNIESWETIISVARTFLVFINNYQFITLMIVIAVGIFAIKFIIRIGTGGQTYYYPSNKDEE